MLRFVFPTWRYRYSLVKYKVNPYVVRYNKLMQQPPDNKDHPAADAGGEDMHQTITIETEYITLGQLLQEAGVIDSGGIAKLFLADYEVFVNDEPEQRRGRKLYHGDEIDIEETGRITVFSNHP
ncbi:S4 domain-containing protein YaaA [Salibacterium sp. K-3]